MTNKITRRAFLKCTGAVAVAAGMAGALSGCDLVDNIMNNVMDQTGANGVTFNSVGVSCSFGAVCREDGKEVDGKWQDGPIKAVYVNVDFSSVSRQPYTIKTSHFTLDVDDAPTEVVIGDEAIDYCGGGDRYLFKDKDSVTLSAITLDANEIEKCNANGIVAFKLKTPVDTWNKVTLKIQMNGGTAVFTGTPENNGNTIDMKVNR